MDETLRPLNIDQRSAYDGFFLIVGSCLLVARLPYLVACRLPSWESAKGNQYLTRGREHEEERDEAARVGAGKGGEGRRGGGRTEEGEEETRTRAVGGGWPRARRPRSLARGPPRP